MSRQAFADLHQHVLWGLDDGPKTPEQMHAMLGMAVRDGIGLIAATTHAYPGLRAFDMETYLARLNEANRYCREQGWALRVMGGCEIHYSDNVADLLRAGRLPTLGESRMVLIEFDQDASAEEIEEAADRLYLAGCQPIIAHVERVGCLVRSPRKAMEIREEHGVFFQMNCATVLHPRGFRTGHFVRKMLEAQAIDLVATDAHDTAVRPVRMQDAHRLLAEKYGSDYAHHLTHFDVMGEKTEQV